MRERSEAMESRRDRPGRRDVLGYGGLALAGISLAGCDMLSTAPDADSAEKTRTDKGPEAPALADLVKQGELPPVEKRLPAKPLVVQPHTRVGSYGGEWNTAISGPADTSWLNYTVGYEYLVRWRPDTQTFSKKDILPNIAEAFEFNDAGTEYTFTLRKGMRWSDGEPFTADDIAFAYEDVLLNADLYPEGPSSYLLGGDEPAKFERLDQYRIRFTFAEPNGMFLESIAADGFALTIYPRHYFEQFHPDYNSDLDRLIEEEGVADWTELFESKGGSYGSLWEVSAVPRLHAWMPTTAVGEGSRVVFERNPFYWKVDPSGSQLPYIDKVVYDIIADPQVMLTRALNGDFHLHSRHFNLPQNKPVLAADRQTGNYDFFDISPAQMNTMIIALNLTHKDPVKREIFNNTDFRIGLSHAINREEIIDAVYQRQGEPWQAAPRKESELYDAEMAKQYTEYDVALANEHLDRAGYTERDGEGLRLGPDGRPITFTVEFASGTTEYPDVLDLIKQYWFEVGITARIRPVERSLFYVRKGDNEHDANVWGGDGGLELALDPRWYAPVSSESNFGVAWAEWYSTMGEGGAEPPEPVRRQHELYRQVRATPDAAEQAELLREILAIAKEEFYVIGISSPVAGYGIVHNDVHNVPKAILGSAYFITPAPSNTCQYFIE